MRKLASWIIRIRIPIIVLTVIITAVLGYFIKDMDINADILSFLPADDPLTVLNAEVSERYGGSQLAIVGIESDDVFTEKIIRAVEALTSDFQLIDGVQGVTSLTNVMDIRREDDWLEVGRLIEAGTFPEDEGARRELREYVLGKEMFRGRLVSSDGRATIIVCRLQDDADKPAIAKAIKDTVARLDLDAGITYAGLPFQLIEINNLVMADMIRLVPLAAVLILLSLYLSFRSIRGVALPLLSSIISSVWTMGIMSLAGVSFSVITNVIPVVLIAVGSAYSIHVISAFGEAVTAGVDRIERSKLALSRVALPVVLAAVTTMAGFTAFVFGSYLTMIKDFGIFSTLGIFFAVILSLTLIPSILSLLPSSLKGGRKGVPSGGVSSSTARFADFSVKHGKAVAIAGAVIIVVSLFGIPRIKREVDILSYFRRNTDIRLSEEMMKERFGGSTTLQIVVGGDILDPGVLRSMKEMEEFLERRTELNNVYSIVELVEEMNYAMVDERALPDSEDKIANLWFLMEGEESLYQLVSEGRDEAVIQATIKNQNIKELNELVRAISGHIEEHTTDNVSYRLAGSLLVYHRIDAGLRRSQVQSLLIAVSLVLLCNIILLRSAAGALIGLIPIAFTLFVLYGVMGLFGVPLDVATVLIGSISLGIGIDYSIHFLNRFRREYRRGGDIGAALRATVGTTGKAIVINVATVALGFISLVLGNLIPLRRFGMLITITMLASGAGALFLLPSIMLLSPRLVIAGVIHRLRGGDGGAGSERGEMRQENGNEGHDVHQEE